MSPCAGNGSDRPAISVLERVDRRVLTGWLRRPYGLIGGRGTTIGKNSINIHRPRIERSEVKDYDVSSIGSLGDIDMRIVLRDRRDERHVNLFAVDDGCGLMGIVVLNV